MDNKIIARIKQLCQEKGISYYRLAKLSKIPNTTLTNMLSKNTIPSVPTIEKLCKGFGISLSQFFAVDHSYPDLTSEQVEILTLWDSLPIEKKETAKHYLYGLNGLLPDAAGKEELWN